MPRSLTDAELEATLRDLGAHIAYPSAPAGTTHVRARLVAAARPRPWILALAPALVTLLIIGLGAAAAEVISLRGVDIFRVPASAVPTPTARATGTTPPAPAFGQPISLDEARRTADLRIVVPSSAQLGAPVQVFRADGPTGSIVTFVYAPNDTLPQSSLSGVGALVTELRGAADVNLFGKAVGPDTRLERVTVNGAQGVWLDGAPHLFFYRDAQGNVFQETLRLAGNTLLWEQDGVLLRLEAQVTREQALAIASGIR